MNESEHAMRLFYFLLKVGSQTFPDVEGQELADEVAARDHAVAVAQELMYNRENQTRLWRIQVCDDYLHPCFEVLFAAVDPSLPKLPANLQGSIERVVRTAGALNDAMVQMRATLRDCRETLARADQFLSSISRLPRA
jgi:hypothetical protein